VLYKKRWSDGLHDDFEHLNEFELKFGLFGGDGGGGGGGGSSSPDTSSQNARAAAQEPARGRSSTVSAAPATGFRGEQSAAAEGMRAAERAANASLDRASAADRVEQAVSRAVFDSGYYDTPQTQTAPGLREMAPTAFVDNQLSVAPSRPSALDSVSFTPDIPAYDMPTFSDYMGMIDTPQMNVPDIPTSPAAGLMDSVRGLNQFDIGPGTLSVTPEFGSKGLTGGMLEYSVPIGPTSSLQNTGNPMVDAIIGGMNNAAANPAPATTDLAFTDTFTNVFGGLSNPVEFVGNNLAKKGNTYTSASSGGITSTRRQPSMYDKIAGTGKSLADQVGIGSLFN
jgi:hypothetical protein